LSDFWLLASDSFPGYQGRSPWLVPLAQHSADELPVGPAYLGAGRQFSAG